MWFLHESIFDGVGHSNIAALVLGTAWQSFVVMAVAGMVCLCLRRTSAAMRHLILFLSVAGLPLLPLFSSLLPAWQQPLWMVSGGSSLTPKVSGGLERISNPTPTVPQARRTGTGVVVQRNANWKGLCFFIWAGGAVTVFVSILRARWRVGQFERCSEVLCDSAWMALLAKLCGQLRIRRQVILLQCDGMPERK